MVNFESLELWFITGSQHLYGEETLGQVAANSQTIAAALDADPHLWRLPGIGFWDLLS